MARKAQAIPDDVQPGGANDNAAEPPQPSVRGLKITVTVLGILLIVGFIVVFSTIIYRAVKLGGEGAADGRPAKPGFGVIETLVPAGSQVVRMSLDGDRLAVELRGADGQEIVIYDVRRGHELGRIKIVPK